MRHVRKLQMTVIASLIAACSIYVFGSKVQAHHGVFHESSWQTSMFIFGTAPNSWDAVPQKIFNTNPDQARAYLCQNFGFFNCQVAAPDTQVAAGAHCWSGTVGSSNVTSVASSWANTIATVACPAGFPNIGTSFVKVRTMNLLPVP